MHHCQNNGADRLRYKERCHRNRTMPNLASWLVAVVVTAPTGVEVDAKAAAYVVAVMVDTLVVTRRPCPAQWEAGVTVLTLVALAAMEMEAEMVKEALKVGLGGIVVALAVG
jgi:hypothetical protein